jgi:chemotaxis protein CheD
MTGIATSPEPPMQRIALMQGQVLVCAVPQVEITTVLGSCVATCLFDRKAQIGGINHFLLAIPPATYAASEIDRHYGVYLMELLITDMLAHGASRQRLRAHLYGGANLHPGMAPIGTANADFSRAFLKREHISLVHDDLGGVNARRIHFWPTLAKVSCQIVGDHAAPVQANPDDGLSRTKRDCENE